MCRWSSHLARERAGTGDSLGRSAYAVASDIHERLAELTVTRVMAMVCCVRAMAKSRPGYVSYGSAGRVITTMHESTACKRLRRRGLRAVPWFVR